MEDSLFVDEVQAFDELVEVLFYPLFLKRRLTFLYMLVHVSFHEFED
jgi:hypothetical protein